MKKSLMIGVLIITLLFLWGCSGLGQSERNADIVFQLDDIQLSAMQIDDTYQDFILTVGGESKEWDWISITKSSFAPEMDYAHLTSAEKEELVVSIVEAAGSGVLIQEIHVIDLDTLEEYPVIPILDVLEAELINLADDSSYTVGRGDEIYTLRKDQTSVADENLTEVTWFESYHKYEVVDGTLLGYTMGAISPAVFWIEVIVEYGFENGVFVPVDISFRSLV